MSKPSNSSLHLTAQPVYLAASAIHNLIRPLPAGAAYFIGIVLVTIFTGQLAQHHGSLARAALPYVVHLRWGWHGGRACHSARSALVGCLVRPRPAMVQGALAG